MRESTTSEVLEQGEVGEAVGEHAADAVDVDDRLVGPLLRLRRRRALRRPRERSHRIGFREGRSKVKARRENAALRCALAAADGLRPPAGVQERGWMRARGSALVAWCGAARV